ncbi:unnamed protein product [Malus baccata var. baccata]
MFCKFFFAFSVCIYPETKQLDTNVILEESDAWPAEISSAAELSNWAFPQHLWTPWNLERSAYTCEFCHDLIHNTRARAHFCTHIFIEKAPAAFCRKSLTSTDKFEMWGDGLQTRSFTFIDECDGLRITYFWIKEQLEKEKAQGSNQSGYGSSKVGGTQAPLCRRWICHEGKVSIPILVEKD